jgi:O-antigen ligase
VFNTVNSRLSAYQVSIDRWQDNPFFGAGIRWFKWPGQETVEPHSALFATLSETGLWGLIAVALLFGGAWWVMRTDRSPLATAALAVLAVRLVEGQVAIFWLAGTMTLPWLLVGLAAAQPIDAPLRVPPSRVTGSLGGHSPARSS